MLSLFLSLILISTLIYFALNFHDQFRLNYTPSSFSSMSGRRGAKIWLVYFEFIEAENILHQQTCTWSLLNLLENQNLYSFLLVLMLFLDWPSHFLCLVITFHFRVGTCCQFDFQCPGSSSHQKFHYLSITSSSYLIMPINLVPLLDLSLKCIVVLKGCIINFCI